MSAIPLTDYLLEGVSMQTNNRHDLDADCKIQKRGPDWLGYASNLGVYALQGFMFTLGAGLFAFGARAMSRSSEQGSSNSLEFPPDANETVYLAEQ
jgi:hypothetical protein